MVDRKYTVQEIERMRRAIRLILFQPPGIIPEGLDSMVEDQLRTYLVAGTTPEELDQVSRDIMRGQIEARVRD